MVTPTKVATGGTNDTNGDNLEDPYFRSYFAIRTAVGIMGLVLPLLLVAGEIVLDGSVQVRGSLSAYYHSSMRDFFVGGLCVTGILLITYLSGQRRTLAYWASTVAGIAVLGVAFIPTGRPDLPPGAVLCGHASPAPAGCTAIEQSLGETQAATIHFTCAVVFIVGLAAMSFLFAAPDRAAGLDPGQARKRRLQYACGGAILLAVVFVALGALFKLHHIGILTPLYIGEVVSVLAFGVSWLAEGKFLRSLARLRLRPAPTPTPAPAPTAS